MSGEKRPIDLQYERDRMMAFVDEIADEFMIDPGWLDALGIEPVIDDGWFEMRKADRLFLVEAGPDLTVLVNGKTERPKNLFFDGAYCASIKGRIIDWATDVDTSE